MITTNRTEQQKQFIQLRAQGKSYSDISAELGISKSSCSNWAKKYAAEIEHAKKQKPADSGKAKPVKKDQCVRGFSVTRREITTLKSFEDVIHLAAKIVSDQPESEQRVVTGVIEPGDAMEDITEALSFILSVISYYNKYIQLLPPEEQNEALKDLEQQLRAYGKKPKQLQRSGIEPPTAAKLPTINFDKSYAAALSAGITTNLSTINTTISQPEIDPVTGNATIKLGNGFVLHIENYARTGREWKVSTIKLLRYCTILLAKANHYREKNPSAIQTDVVFTIADYMKLLGKSQTERIRKRVRAQLIADIDTLDNSRIKWTEKRKGRNRADRAFLNTPLLGGSSGINKQGNVIVRFSREMAECLVQDAFFTQYPLLLFKTDERNPVILPLGDKLSTHSSIDNNIRRGTANIISVKKLLKALQAQIPSYKTVMKEDRHWERRIKDPLEKGFDGMKDCVRWEYCNSKGLPLSDEQLADTSYANFASLYIHFEMIGAPDQTERLQAKAERAKKRKAKKANKKESDSGNAPDTQT